MSVIRDRLRTLADRLSDPLGMGEAVERGLSLDPEAVEADLREGRTGGTDDADAEGRLVDRIEAAAEEIDGLEFDRGGDDEVPVLRIED